MAIALLVPSASSADGASFEVLPFTADFFVDGDEFLDLSADGSTVVGFTFDDSRPIARQATRWDEGGGTTLLGVLNPNSSSPLSEAYGISGDGSTIVGLSNVREYAVIFEPDGSVRSFEDEGLSGAGSVARDASFDGSVIVGSDYSSAPNLGGFLWDEANGARSLSTLMGRTDIAVPAAISDDGRVVTGLLTDNAPGSLDESFRWTEGGTLDLIGPVDGLDWSLAHGISGDGSTIVGGSGNDGFPSVLEAFRWTEAGGTEGLGQVDYQLTYAPVQWTSERTIAFAASEDGSVIVGGGETAWIHAEQYGGMIGVRDLLISLGIQGLENWNLFEAVDVSADGRVITGWGTNTAIGLEDIAWRAVVPEPSTTLLLGLGLGLLATGRSREPGSLVSEPRRTRSG